MYDIKEFELVNSYSSIWDTQIKGGDIATLYNSKVTVRPKNEVSFEFMRDLLTEICEKYKTHVPIVHQTPESDLIIEIIITDLHL